MAERSYFRGKCSAKLFLWGFLLLGLTPAFAQSAGGRLGDATVTPGLAAKGEPYGLSNFEGGSSQSFSTRHYRKANDGGIGSSYLQTTSATVESRPPLSYASPAADENTRLRADLSKIRSLADAQFHPLAASGVDPLRESTFREYSSLNYQGFATLQTPSSAGLSSDLFGRRTKERGFGTFNPSSSSGFSLGIE